MNFDTGSFSSSFPFLEQHQDGDTGHRLRLRRDAEDGVLLHRRRLLAIERTERLELGHVPVARDQRHHTGNSSLIGVGLHRLMQPFEALR